MENNDTRAKINTNQFPQSQQQETCKPTPMDIELERRCEEFRNNVSACFLETIQTVVIALDNDGQIMVLNSFLENLTGYNQAEILGKKWTDLFLMPEHHHSFNDALTQTLAGKPVRGLEIPIRTRNNFEILLRWNCSPLPSDENSQSPGILAIGYDMTELLQKEKQLLQAQKMEAVGRLASGIAHDFNNQLSVIQGYCDLLSNGFGEEATFHECINEMGHATERASILTSQLLSFSRKQILRPQIINFNEIILSMRSPLRRLLGEDITLNINTGQGLCNAKADPVQLEQAIFNMAINARDAMTNAGQLTIEIKKVKCDRDELQSHNIQPGHFVKVSITDSGEGMDEQTCQLIFDPFFTTKEVGRGTGLGLAMVYGFVKQSNGFIEVQSEKGKGTEFSLYFPAQKTNAQQHRKSRLAPCDSHKGNETILVAEDEETVRTLIVRILQNCGYTVLDAGSGRQALPIGEHYDGNIHLLITDIAMPEMSGPSLANRLTKARPNMKLLFMSGHGDETLMRHVEKLDKKNILPKPFRPAEFAKTVRQILDS